MPKVYYPRALPQLKPDHALQGSLVPSRLHILYTLCPWKAPLHFRNRRMRCPARLVSALAAALLGISVSVCPGASLPSGKAHAIGAATTTAVGTSALVKPVPAPYGLGMEISPVGSAIQSAQPLALRLVLRNRGEAPLKLFLDTWGTILTRVSVVGQMPRKGLCALSRLGRHPAWRYLSFVGGHWVMDAPRGGGIVTGLALRNVGKTHVQIDFTGAPPMISRKLRQLART